MAELVDIGLEGIAVEAGAVLAQPALGHHQRRRGDLAGGVGDVVVVGVRARIAVVGGDLGSPGGVDEIDAGDIGPHLQRVAQQGPALAGQRGVVVGDRAVVVGDVVIGPGNVAVLVAVVEEAFEIVGDLPGDLVDGQHMAGAVVLDEAQQIAAGLVVAVFAGGDVIGAGGGRGIAQHRIVGEGAAAIVIAGDEAAAAVVEIDLRILDRQGADAELAELVAMAGDEMDRVPVGIAGGGDLAIKALAQHHRAGGAGGAARLRAERQRRDMPPRWPPAQRRGGAARSGGEGQADRRRS